MLVLQASPSGCATESGMYHSGSAAPGVACVCPAAAHASRVSWNMTPLVRVLCCLLSLVCSILLYYSETTDRGPEARAPERPEAELLP